LSEIWPRISDLVLGFFDALLFVAMSRSQMIWLRL
jgi:hypothetical protein